MSLEVLFVIHSFIKSCCNYCLNMIEYVHSDSEQSIWIWFNVLPACFATQITLGCILPAEMLITHCTACISCKNILIRSSCQHEDFKITLLLGFCMWMKNFLFLSNLSTYSECQFYLAQFSNVLISSIGLMPSTLLPGTLEKL